MVWYYLVPHRRRCWSRESVYEGARGWIRGRVLRRRRGCGVAGVNDPSVPSVLSAKTNEREVKRAGCLYLYLLYRLSQWSERGMSFMQLRPISGCHRQPSFSSSSKVLRQGLDTKCLTRRVGIAAV